METQGVFGQRIEADNRVLQKFTAKRVTDYFTKELK